MKRQRQSNPKDDEEALLPLNNQFKDDDEGAKKGGFFACYLLCSLSPRFKGHTYIGFTVNPRRRIRQHNGEIKCGAFRTKSKRPWEMTLCVYGFPTNVSALQFEWAWQHPRESLAVRNAAATFKTLSGFANKVKLAYTMLTLSPWQSLKLTVNFFSTKYMKHAAGCPSLPKQMKVQFCPIDELHCYTNSDQILDEEGDGQEGEDASDENGKDYGHEELTDISVCDTLVHPCGTTTIDYNGMRRDATATIGQTKETLTLREDDDKSPFHHGDSPLRIPSSSNSCFANVTIAAENEDPLRLVQENCSKLGRASRQQMATSSSPNEDQERSATSLISSYQFGSTEPNDTSKKENSKCQYSLIDSPSETTFSCAFDLGNNVETIEGRNFLGFAEGNNNGVGQAPEKQLRIPSVANNGKLPFTNGVHASPEVEVINLLTPSSNSITRYFRKKKKVSSVSNEIIDLTRSPNFVQL